MENATRTSNNKQHNTSTKYNQKVNPNKKSSNRSKANLTHSIRQTFHRITNPNTNTCFIQIHLSNSLQSLLEENCDFCTYTPHIIYIGDAIPGLLNGLRVRLNCCIHKLVPVSLDGTSSLFDLP